MTITSEDAWIPEHELTLNMLYAVTENEDGSRTLQCELDCDECGCAWEHQSRHAKGAAIAMPIDALHCPTCRANGTNTQP